MKKKISIIGSCCTRDAINTEKIEVINYMARTSLTSQYSEKITEKYEIKLESKFQKKLVMWDLEKRIDIILNDSSEYIIMDFIDDRLKKKKINSSIYTISSEFTNSGIEFLGNEVNEEEELLYFENACKLFFNECSKKIIILKIYAAKKDIYGTENKGIDKINSKLEKIYKIISKFNIHIIEFDEKLLISDPAHKWGNFPVHFIKEFYDYIFDSIEKIMITNDRYLSLDFHLNEFKKENKIKIGIVGDEAYYQMFEDVATLIYITKDNVDIYKDKIDYFLFITPWKGCLNEVTEESNLFIFNQLKNSKCKKVFYSKEDPLYYKSFLKYAKYCDEIYTSSIDMVNKYKVECNNPNVFLKYYSISPEMYNPIGLTKDTTNGFHFAGSYINHTYDERKKDMEMIFDDVIKNEYELKIRNRNSHLENKNYIYPIKYNTYLHQRMSYSKLHEEQKKYVNHININSVKYDFSMSDIRAYELQAMGSLVYSNYSIALSNLFPNIHFITEDNEIEYYSKLSEYEKYELRMQGIRNIYSGEYLNIDFINKLSKREIEIKLLIVVDNKKSEEVLKKQTYKKYDVVYKKEVKEEIINKYDYVMSVGEKEDFSMYMIEDLMNAFKYTNSECITISENEESFVFGEGEVQKNKSIFKTKEININEYINLDKIKSKFFKINNNLIIKEIIKEKEKYKFSVIIPIYNNGIFLKNRCLISLKKMKNFSDVEILLIDDGSTNQDTINIIKEEMKKYKNMKAYFFDDGGSGSASRPRNKGLELASTDYVTYLDPDNELINDKYNDLYEELIKGKYDFIIGKMRILSKKTFLYPTLKIEGKEIEILNFLRFQPLSMQAGMFRKKYLIIDLMSLPEGLISQDTLMYYDMILNTTKFKLVDEPVHKYYSLRTDSVTNSINLSSLEGAIKLEKIKKEIFEKHNMLEMYLEIRNDINIEYILVDRLKQLKLEDFPKGVKVIREVIDIYGIENIKSEKLKKLYYQNDENINLKFFIELEEKPIVPKTNIISKSDKEKDEEIKKLTKWLDSKDYWLKRKDEEIDKYKNRKIIRTIEYIKSKVK